MTKQLLLATAAAGVLALSGQATAQEITIARVSGIDVTNAPYPVASETVNDSTNRVALAGSGNNVVAFQFGEDESGLAAEAGARYRFVQSFTGAVLAAAVGTGDRSVLINGNPVSGDLAACFTVSTNAGTGSSGQSNVSYDVLVAAAATGADNPSAVACETSAFAQATSGTFGFQFDKAFRTSSITAVSTTITGSISPSNTLVTADDRAVFTLTQPLAAVTNGYSVTIEADEGEVTQLELTSDPIYTSISDGEIGNVGYGPTLLGEGDFAAGNAFVGYDAETLPLVTADLTLNAVGGTFEFLQPEFNGSDFAIDEEDDSVATFAAASGVGTVSIEVANDPTTAISLSPIGFNITVEPALVADEDSEKVTIDGSASDALETLGLEGSTFLAPWVQSANPNYNTVVRLSNSGSATGAVILSLASSIVAPTQASCNSTTLAKLASIPANGELAITSADLTTCFGAFTRGDLTITILSLNDNLTAKLRIVSPGNVVSEQSLDRTSGTGFNKFW